MKKIISSLLLILVMNNKLIAQNPKHKELDDFESRFAKDYSSHKIDSNIHTIYLQRQKKY